MGENAFFLELPAELRIKIYSLAGLERPCSISVEEECYRSHAIKLYKEKSLVHGSYRRRLSAPNPLLGLDCRCDILPCQLLYVCKQVYAEAQEVLYGRNVFVLSSSHLAVLSKLSSGALAALNAIDICVPTALEKGDAEAFLQSIQPLIRGVKLSAFSLGIWCQTDKVAGRILIDGLKTLQGIKDLSLTLDDSPDPESSFVVKSAVLSLTNRAPVSFKPFRFTELPTEIRHHILSYTDLVPRYINHEWCSRVIEIKDGRVQRPRRSCCKTCTNSLAACACWFNGGAFSTRCTCYSHPYALFMASRSINADATYVYFSSNRFILSSKSYVRSHSEFLLSLPNHALQSIRKLDIQISMMDFVPYDPQCAAAYEFSCLLEIIFTKFNLPALHLTLNSDLEKDKYSVSTDYGNIVGWLEWALVNYRRIARITTLELQGQGLDRFEVFLGEGSEEDKIERTVMGNGYDALARGKLLREERLSSNPHMKLDKKGEAI